MHLVLKYIRENVLGLSHRQMGTALGVAHTTYAIYERTRNENGKRTKVTIDFLKEYCEAFNLDKSVMLDICKIGIDIDTNAIDLEQSIPYEQWVLFLSLIKKLKKEEDNV